MSNLFITLRIGLVLLFYFWIQHTQNPWAVKIVYPIKLWVTFLHEAGHALMAIASGGSVNGIQINENGGGHCETVGGIRWLVLMGGYIGSAVFGNLLFLIGARGERFAEKTLWMFGLLMLYASFFWYQSVFSSAFLVGFAGTLIALAKFTPFDGEIVMFLGLSSILYIIQDFKVGPSSDLQKYAEVVGYFNQEAWMYLWLAFVTILCCLNLLVVYKKE